MPILDLNDSNFWQEISEGYVLIMAGSKHCAPCLKAKPDFERIAEDNPWLEVYYIDLEKNPAAISNLSLYSMPSFIFWHNGMVKKYNGPDMQAVGSFALNWRIRESR